ncbi:MAG: hypothetical protein ACSHWZ_08420 [Sulfitobacter sp.]
MRKTISTLLIAGVLLGGCGYVRGSALNPVNWFGRSVSEPVQAASTNPLIPQRAGLFQKQRQEQAVYHGVPFEEIVDLTVEQVAGGAVIRATGRAARQGRYEVRLTPLTEDETPIDGVLSYRFEGIVAEGTAAGQPQTREVTAARHVTNQALRNVRSIRVEGLLNARVARR